MLYYFEFSNIFHKHFKKKGELFYNDLMIHHRCHQFTVIYMYLFLVHIENVTTRKMMHSEF